MSQTEIKGRVSVSVNGGLLNAADRLKLVQQLSGQSSVTKWRKKKQQEKTEHVIIEV